MIPLSGRERTKPMRAIMGLLAVFAISGAAMADHASSSEPAPTTHEDVSDRGPDSQVDTIHHPQSTSPVPTGEEGLTHTHSETPSSSTTRTSPPSQPTPSLQSQLVRDCVQKRSQLFLPVQTLTLHAHQWQLRPSHNASLTCVLTLVTSEGLVYYVRRVSECSRSNYVEMWDSGRWARLADCMEREEVRLSAASTLHLRLHVGNLSSLSDLSVVVQARRPALEAYMITSKMGVIQTPGHNKGRNYPSNMDSVAKITVPLGHVTLLSALRMLLHTALPGSDQECDPKQADLLQLYTGDSWARQRAWIACHVHFPIPRVYKARILWVRFVSTRKAEQKGFKLLYSFHQEPQVPSRLTSGLWNCSVTWWPEFERHFRCNLEMECGGGEDEVSCYYSGVCGPGLLTLNNRCYEYVHVPRGPKMSWRKSNLECERRGGYLVSLNGPTEWDSIVRVLDMRRSPKQVYTGLYKAPSVLPHIYRYSHMWTDRTMAYYIRMIRMPAFCSYFNFWEPNDMLRLETGCDETVIFGDFLCELDTLSKDTFHVQEAEREKRSEIRVTVPRNSTLPFPSIACPGLHLTHSFMACDVQSACWQRHHIGMLGDAWGVPSATSCPAPMTPLPVMFTCSSDVQRVPYSLVCDHLRQCDDGSDEEFCVFVPCSVSGLFQCGTTRQCVPRTALCDGQLDCSQGNDEDICAFDFKLQVRQPTPPAVVEFTFLSPHRQNQVKFSIRPLFKSIEGCPESHFQCPGHGYCLPIFVLCNGVLDCPHGEDEKGCLSYECRGLYRCYGSKVCLHASHLCDGAYHCPQKDDESFCQLSCPEECTCRGFAFHCSRLIVASLHPNLKFLDADQSGMTLDRVRSNTMLIHLSLKRCGLLQLHNVSLPNLRSLDLSHNLLRSVSSKDLSGFLNLQHLALSANPLGSLFARDNDSHSFPSLLSLDLSGVRVPTFHPKDLSIFSGLRRLNCSLCGIMAVSGKASLPHTLQVIDLRGSPLVHFPRGLLISLRQLQSVSFSNFKLCCPVMLPAHLDPASCSAPQGQLSSCQALLRSDMYRVFLAMFSILALLGNLGCFLLRTFHFQSGRSGFNVFVTHLTLSDFLMGVYLAIIGVADRVYLGAYLWRDVAWRHGVACRVAGFLSLLSNEVSAIIICLITLDRFLVLRFPFHDVHFKHVSAHVVCCVTWVLVLLLAAVPLLPFTSHWQLYSQTSICIPLPMTNDYPGHQYTFGIVVVFNFFLFICIALGQAFIYSSVQANSLSVSSSTKKSNDLLIARRLITVALSDFVCWFPIGLLGLLASRGTPIPGEINVGVAIFVLPVNSALNPFLYTLNVVLEHRRKAQDDRLLKEIMANVS